MNGVCLLIIDPQNDFCDPAGNLFVPGAPEDMKRLSEFVETYKDDVSEIITTLDLHKNYHIAHPIFWRDPEGNMPKAFTTITAKDMQNGRWAPANPEHKDIAFKYLISLEENSRYFLSVWPPHCVIGTPGAGIYPPVANAIKDFEIYKTGRADYVLKSANSLTEHYSALKAEVPVKSDKGTLPNQKLLAKLAEADEIIVAGEALSHCVANTVLDFGIAFGGDLSKFVLLRDAVSSVPGFEYLAEAFLENAAEMGMKMSDTASWGNGL